VDPPGPILRVVVDANIVIAGVLRNSTARRIVMDPRLRLWAPSLLMEETGKHVGEISRRAGIPLEETRHVLDSILELVIFVEREALESQWEEAERLLTSRDPSDAPYVAVALAFELDGVWSDDPDIRVQGRVRTYTTPELVRLLPPIPKRDLEGPPQRPGRD